MYTTLVGDFVCGLGGTDRATGSANLIRNRGDMGGNCSSACPPLNGGSTQRFGPTLK